MFSLSKVRDGVYYLLFDSHRELSMTFVRYQEFYESQYDHIRDHSFSLVEQMGTYVRKQKNDPNAIWTYSDDWGGYNMPVANIKKCVDAGIPDPNFYDALMQGIYGLIMADSCHEDAYLIGTYDSDADDVEKKNYYRHELTHAMFYLDKNYQEECKHIINSVSKELLEELFNALKIAGYPEKTSLDEIQAYITTGEGGYFDLVESQEELDELRIQLRKLWRKSFPEFYPDLEI